MAFIGTMQAQQLPMRLWYDRPAHYFEESMPIGNGKIGALVYGGANNDTIYLNDITYWTGCPVDHREGAGKSAWIPEIRKALFCENYKLADSLQHNVQGSQSAFYQPLGTLHLINSSPSKPTHYYRELSLDSSIVKVKYTQNGVEYHKEYFASHPDKFIAIRLTASKDSSINTRLMLTAQTPHVVRASKNQLTMVGHAMGQDTATIHACTILRVFNNGGTVMARDSSLVLDGVTDATIYIVNETSFNGYDNHPVRQGADYINNAIDDAWHTQNMTYHQFRERHIKDYQQFYNRVSIRIGNDKTFLNQPTDKWLRNFSYKSAPGPEALYFQFGRYLLISCSRTPGVPANLQGLWTPHLWSPWRGNYTMNINIEENYWPAHVANLSEMAMPLVGFIRGLADNGRYTARNFYGINNGWCAAHNSDIWCKTAPVGEGKESPMWANWNMGGAWLVNTLNEHYLFTQDRAFLDSIAMPLMQGAADFCKEWLVENPHKKGELITAPSTSPENEYITDKGYRGTTCYGATADMAIIRQLLINTGDKHTLKKLQSYTIGHLGDLNEWYHDWDDYDIHHRHQSHLIGLYPENNLPEEFYPAARRTLELKGDESTGWSTGWRINLWARLGDGNHAFTILRNLMRYVSPQEYNGPDAIHRGGTYPNLFDAHPPFQIDGNFGGTAGICEMLLQSHKGYIELLPALPDAWPEGEVRGLCARGGYEIDIKWNNKKVVSARIRSKVGGTVKIRYNGKTIVIKLRKGEEKTII